MQWHTCSCPQWDEQRLEARAAQIADRVPNPRRRLFQPTRVAHQQPQSRVGATGSTAAPVSRPASPSSSIWESDWTDHSVWESDWGFDDEDDDEVPFFDPPTPTADHVAPVMPAIPTTTDGHAQSRNQRIADAMQLLRDNHERKRDRWRWIRGPRRCEECRYLLREYIFECRQCRLQACNRCRRNRL